MSAQWTADIVGKMHLNGISQSEMSEKIQYSREYVNAVLNGRRSPKKAEQKFRKALNELIAEKSK